VYERLEPDLIVTLLALVWPLSVTAVLAVFVYVPETRTVLRVVPVMAWLAPELSEVLDDDVEKADVAVV
jgi:hypothetical protein